MAGLAILTVDAVAKIGPDGGCTRERRSVASFVLTPDDSNVTALEMLVAPAAEATDASSALPLPGRL